MRQYIVDAFTKTPFTGNPAAVCVTPQWPAEPLMQRIASENNLSETAFVVPQEGSDPTQARFAIRWFTPESEIDLCGHATLASAFIIKKFFARDAARIRFSSQSGTLYALCQDELITLDFPSRPAKPLGLRPEFEAALHAPVLELYLSRDVMAVLRDEAAVRALTPDFAKMAGLPEGEGFIVTAPGEGCDFVSRCFYPKCGVNEDPVTGSAHCSLIPYWAQRLGKSRMAARQLSKRGGELLCEDLGSRVHISGSAVLYAVGDLIDFPFDKAPHGD